MDPAIHRARFSPTPCAHCHVVFAPDLAFIGLGGHGAGLRCCPGRTGALVLLAQQIDGKRLCAQTSPGAGWTRDSAAFEGPGCQPRRRVIVVPMR
ncbi:hypothetical protein [Acidovorax carolinensis]|uniref:hypothetical protein n=1 Tax=Acidovorax carolinensis TaxID=553814 RepID=UPI003002309A